MASLFSHGTLTAEPWGQLDRARIRLKFTTLVLGKDFPFKHTMSPGEQVHVDPSSVTGTATGPSTQTLSATFCTGRCNESIKNRKTLERDSMEAGRLVVYYFLYSFLHTTVNGMWSGNQ